MSLYEITALVLLAVGAIINFLVPPILKKKSPQEENLNNKIYIIKSIGLVLVIAGCITFFLLGGKFGV
ncbi:MAG: hypothetical protein J6R66_05255 [Clostridia bacterium]|nr:hypothetical protein [Clostridia bacterium]